MLKFVDIAAKRPDKRDPEERRDDWNEVYHDYVPGSAVEQASRCSQCGVPFCQIHCPVQNNIPDWLMLTAAGRLQEAYEISSATNNFPEICGRICPQDLLCEGNCVIEKGFDSVTIGAVERYITDTAFAEGWVKAARPALERSES
ncbi:MAG: NAD(P)-dependent oxidoreductase, partial [Alphaproteobacteria bacterium]